MLSSTDTTCHSDVLTKDGMLGFCVMSSSELIALAALTEIEYSSDLRSIINSLIVFFKIVLSIILLSMETIKIQ